MWNITATEETLQRCLCRAEGLRPLMMQMRLLRKMAPGFVREGLEMVRPLAQDA